ncbi:sugar-transfer associated ATP-grasp domain-containing protein [Thioclava pacifica]|uniref:Alpha-L-glutamate ligase-related protein ATP-grasp domain-containing protein n=1 Tax=Thioclava pacifica DSM 10166 TaxID=1353537 RepID=A0A074JNB1_9RHOB|nr:sugar-transfer associated ATP-grasp domain-containing protein [Thioclava pacifica]KEO50872.1 hypothetical protein TP2_13370 [Thioclava pacifica DSM 10166]
MRAGLKTVAKATIASLKLNELRWRKRREAEAGLRVLEAHGRKITEATRQRAREAAKQSFGHERHAPWLMLYAAARGGYQDGWLPESFYAESLMPQVNGIAHHLCRVQATNPIFFDSPAICDLLYLLNGRILTPQQVAIAPSEALERLRASGEMLVFKADHSAFGKGVQSVATRDLDLATLNGLGNGVFQTLLRPHPELARFGTPALATLRIATVLGEIGAPQIRASYLKIGQPGQAHVLARDQLRVAVDWESGELAPEGFHADWRPATGAQGADRFAGNRVPAITEAVATALELHRQLPLARFICWDFAIDEAERVRLLEWEGGVISFAEATQGPCFQGLGWPGLA